MNVHDHTDLRPRASDAAAFLDPVGGSALTSVLLRMLDEVDYGLLLVTATGSLRYGNQLGLGSLAGSTALRLNGGFVSAGRAADQTALRTAIADAARGLRRLLCLQSEHAGTSIAVLPIAGDDDAAGARPGEPLVMLVLGKQPASRSLTLDFFARLHRLTGAESNVLQGLCGGLRPKEIAEQVGVEISTVRTQIGSVRTKTQTTSIRELINKVAALPPVTPAMKNVVSH